MNTNITVIILAYNEEKRIANVINGLKGFDHIIVLDKSSTDKTAAIAESMGAKIIKRPYTNDSPSKESLLMTKKYLLEEQPNDWIFEITSSDIVHHALLNEMKKAIAQNQDHYDVIEVPLYRYAMGVTGRNTFHGEAENKSLLWKRGSMITEPAMIHESPYEDIEKYRMKIADPRIAIYHLTHANLDLVMDRHWRYAVQYVEDAAERGRGRERVMRYAINECIRTVFRYFRRGIFKSKETGKAQLMTLIMYNCLIYLNAFFSKEKEAEIQEIYQQIMDECRGN